MPMGLGPCGGSAAGKAAGKAGGKVGGKAKAQGTACGEGIHLLASLGDAAAPGFCFLRGHCSDLIHQGAPVAVIAGMGPCHLRRAQGAAASPLCQEPMKGLTEVIRAWAAHGGGP